MALQFEFELELEFKLESPGTYLRTDDPNLNSNSGSSLGELVNRSCNSSSSSNSSSRAPRTYLGTDELELQFEFGLESPSSDSWKLVIWNELDFEGPLRYPETDELEL